MVLKKISYKIRGKKYHISAHLCDTPWKKFRGLMFRKNPEPLFFTFNKEKNLTIHSLFCKPFKIIWLDKNLNSTKVSIVKKPKLHISGKGKYLLEIPL